jgi:hypothetical protein
LRETRLLTVFFRLIHGRAVDGARPDDPDPAGWRVDGRDVVDDDPTAADGDDDLGDRWRPARRLLVYPLALATVVLPDEDAPMAGRQAHRNTGFHDETRGNPLLYKRIATAWCGGQPFLSRYRAQGP